MSDAAIPKDILERTLADYGPEQADEVTKRVRDAITGEGNGTRERHMRCVLHLAGGDRDRLEHYIECCRMDPRDVMWWAEYDREDTKRRLRDFDRPFGSETLTPDP